MNERSAHNLELVGGHLCLDLANTVSSRADGPGRDYVRSYDDLVDWSEHAGLLRAEEADHLRAAATAEPGEATAVLRRAIALREAVYRAFAGLVAGHQPSDADLETSNAELAAALAHLRLGRGNTGFAWVWQADGDALARMLWPIARSAAELLTSDDLPRLRVCAGEGCDWLFVDLSKNGSRRWCTMAACGSRSKARRYYWRQQGETKASGGPQVGPEGPRSLVQPTCPES